MNDAELGLLQAIHDDPEEDAPRLIYADWLEENGQTDRAEYIRIECEMEHLMERDARREALDEQATQLWRKHEEQWDPEIGNRLWFDRGMWAIDLLDNNGDLPPQGRTWLKANHWHVPSCSLMSVQDREVERHVDDGMLALFPILSIRHSWITNVSLELISNLPAVRSLKLEGLTDIDDAGMKHLANLSQLQSLSALDTGLSAGGVQWLVNQESLSRLTIRDVNSENVEHLCLFPRLRYLNLHEVRLLSDQYKPFRALQQLEHLCLSTTGKLSAKALRHLRNLPELRRLELTTWEVREPIIRELGRFTQLQTLKLPEYCESGDAGWLAHLHTLPDLRDFFPGNTFWKKEKGFAALAGLTSLESLSLQRTSITGRALCHLRPLKKLRSLSLRGSFVTDTGIRYLMELPSLQYLDVRGSQITDKGREQIRTEMPHVYLLE